MCRPPWLPRRLAEHAPLDALPSTAARTNQLTAAHGTWFADRAREYGLPSPTSSVGAGLWGDVNGDRLPDLFLGFHFTGLDTWSHNSHSPEPSFYINEGGNRFVQRSLFSLAGVAPTLQANCSEPAGTGVCLRLNRSGDLHGGAFHDFDGDGDQDLFISTGGQGGLG